MTYKRSHLKDFRPKILAISGIVGDIKKHDVQLGLKMDVTVYFGMKQTFRVKFRTLGYKSAFMFHTLGRYCIFLKWETLVL